MARIGGQNRAFVAAIRAPNAPSSENDISFAIFSFLQDIAGNPWVSKMAPFCYLITAGGGLNSGYIKGLCRMTRIGGQNWAFFAAIRGPNGPSSEDDIMFAIYLDPQGNRGKPMGIQIDLFLLAKHGRGWP